MIKPRVFSLRSFCTKKYNLKPLYLNSRCEEVKPSDKCINVPDPSDTCCEMQVCDVTHDAHEDNTTVAAVDITSTSPSVVHVSLVLLSASSSFLLVLSRLFATIFGLKELGICSRERCGDLVNRIEIKRQQPVPTP